MVDRQPTGTPSHDEFDEMVDEGEKRPPASLVVYARERHLHPKPGKGRDWWANVPRDIIITDLVRLVCDHYRIAATRNTASRDKNPRKPCAADIVATALTRSNVLGRSDGKL